MNNKPRMNREGEFADMMAAVGQYFDEMNVDKESIISSFVGDEYEPVFKTEMIFSGKQGEFILEVIPEENVLADEIYYVTNEFYHTGYDSLALNQYMRSEIEILTEDNIRSDILSEKMRVVEDMFKSALAFLNKKGFDMQMELTDEDKKAFAVELLKSEMINDVDVLLSCVVDARAVVEAAAERLICENYRMDELPSRNDDICIIAGYHIGVKDGDLDRMKCKYKNRTEDIQL